MLASVLIEYNSKSLNKSFDYIIPSKLINKIKIGQKVCVPFAKNKIEGFILEIHNRKENIDYKEIIDIINPEFFLNNELLELGKYISENYICNLISAYQIMLPKGFKANKNVKINERFLTYVSLSEFDIDKYIRENSRNKKEIEIINILKNGEVLKNKVNSSSLRKLILKGLVKETYEKYNREIDYIKSYYSEITLTEKQNKIYENIINEKEKNKFLLYGVTGSGKTEIYIKVIKYYLNLNKTAILLVPEISLTPQIISRFKNEFNESVAVLHSRLSDGEKYDEYKKIINNEVKVVVGARSAVFAPLKGLGTIIIDECQSAAYKQGNNPKYDALDIAFRRCELNNAKCILGSATPSLGEYARAEKGIYKLLTLDERINKSMPKVSIVNMELEFKKRNFIISDELNKKIIERLSKNEQIIILLNRRGYSTFISCSYCGFVHKCPSCDISLIYHKSSETLRCHYCGYSKKMNNTCPSCKEKTIKDLGMGTEKLEQILSEKYKNARIIRMDQDTTKNKNAHQKIIDSFKNREYDILIGTQMISKGLNFPYVTLVGVINADSSLSIPDYKSGERTFELLMQTSGRSGRNDLLGEVVIQTFNPDNYVLKYIKNYDYISFYKNEMEIRKRLKYPPYFYMISLKIISTDYNLAKDESLKVQKYLMNNLDETFIILGPSTAPMFKMNNKYHFQLIIKYKKEKNLNNVLKKINDNYISNKILIDIDKNI